MEETKIRKRRGYGRDEDKEETRLWKGRRWGRDENGEEIKMRRKCEDEAA